MINISAYHVSIQVLRFFETLEKFYSPQMIHIDMTVVDLSFKKLFVYYNFPDDPNPDCIMLSVNYEPDFIKAAFGK